MSSSWIFQALPEARDLTLDLRSTDTLQWSVRRSARRSARELSPGDRVFYWQAGRDAGIYGIGQIVDIGPRGQDGRHQVRTRHDYPLFAPITRKELMADAALRDLSILRQSRGTVFSLSPQQEALLSTRVGGVSHILFAPAASLRASGLRLGAKLDEETARRLQETCDRGERLVVGLVDDDAPIRYLLATGARQGRGGLIVDVNRGAELTMAEPAPEILRTARSGVIMLERLAPTPRPFLRREEARGACRVSEEKGDYGAQRRPSSSIETFVPDEERVFQSLMLPPRIALSLGAALRSGRHLLLIGAPGTGKTSLALNVARAAAAAGLCEEPLLATATADWTTFDLLGGLVPSADGGRLVFAEGVALRALRENRWLIIDELNRADIDRAFGPFLTILAGASVELPVATTPPIRLTPVDGRAGYEAADRLYRVGSDWRIIATMNTLDRAGLFALSLALSRRFAFITVPAPDAESFLSYVETRYPVSRAHLEGLRTLVRATPRPLGPAVLLDVAAYLVERVEGEGEGYVSFAEALGLFVLPQFDGLDRAEIVRFVSLMEESLGADGSLLLQASLNALWGDV